MTEKTAANILMLSPRNKLTFLSTLFKINRKFAGTDHTFSLSTNIEDTTSQLSNASSGFNTLFLNIHKKDMHAFSEEIVGAITEKNLLVLCYEHHLDHIPDSITDKVKVVPISDDGKFAEQIENALIAHQASLATEQASATAAVPDGQEPTKAV